MKLLPKIVTCALVLGIHARAHAEPRDVASISPLYRQVPSSLAPAPPRAAPPPRPDLGPTPDSAALVHYRHGFYFKAALGGSYLSDTETRSNGPGGRLSGGGYALGVLLGGSLAPGLAVGGGLTTIITDRPTVETHGRSVQGHNSLSFSALAGFVDWYPMPDQGLHLLGMGGFAQLHVSDSAGNNLSGTATGPTFSVGAGYEWSVGRGWGLGAMARYTYASLDMTTAGVTAHESVSSPQLLLTGTLY